MVCCFLEIDNGTMNAKQIRAKYNRYAAWSQSASGQQYLLDLYRQHGASEPRPTFRLLVVARSRTGQDDHRRMQELRAPAAKLSGALRDRLWFTTVADLCRCQQQPLPLEPAIWRKGRGIPGPAGDKRPVVGSEDLSRSLFPAPNSPASSW
jgi:hypothetical protein